ncbi:MAG: hypothetical protein R3Y05_04255 [bacterium]
MSQNEINEEVVKEEVEAVTTSKPVEKVEKKKKNTDKKKEEESWFVKILKEEHKWETYLLGFISCVAMGIGTLFLTDALTFKAGTPILSEYPYHVGWVFVVFGVIGFLLFIIPIFKPTKKEIVHLNYPTKKLFGGNVTRVFLFLTIMALIFMLYESVISAILGKIL